MPCCSLVGPTMFRPRSSGRQRSSRTPSVGQRPVLHVLSPGQNSRDFQDPIEQSLPDHDVVIARAELDLRRAMQQLMLYTHSLVNSLELLTALQLPGSTAALFWTVRLLLKDQLPAKLSDDSPIRRRNHDSRLLYQALTRVNLNDWYDMVVDKAPVTALPATMRFLPGHPIDQRYYRQHPLPAYRHVYLPVATFFAELLDERQQALVYLLECLGATQIEITPLGPAAAHSAPQVLRYARSSQPVAQRFKPADHAWLPYELEWQQLVTRRLAGNQAPVSLDLTLDVNNMIGNQVNALQNLLAQLDSVVSVDEAACYYDYLQPLRVSATF